MADDYEDEMAEEAIAADEKKPLAKEVKSDYTPSYQIMGDTKIAVSKATGKLWESRKNQVIARQKHDGTLDAWNENIRYYRNDQSSGRSETERERGSRSYLARKFGGDTWSETENIIFANVSALVPTLYAKNPDAELSFDFPETEQLAVALEKLLDRLANKKSAPGLNLKVKAKRACLQCCLINESFYEVGYTFKEQSSEQAMLDLQKLSQELAAAKGPKELEEIEGKIAALEDTIDALNPSGPWVKLRSAYDVFIDPDAVLPDNSDANWIMIRDYVSTSFIQAKYGKKNEKGEYESVYQPTVVLSSNTSDTSGSQHEGIDDFNLLPWNDDEAKKYGYDSDTSYRRACRTEVYYVWDKVTRRVFLFNAKDWCWPIWVWDDPYNLSTFFPLVPQTFLIDFDRYHARSEVSYYLDQQDAINTINTEFHKVREWAKNKIIYNKNVIENVTDVENMLRGTGDRTAVGVDLPPDADINKAIQSLAPPSVEYIQLFDKKPIYEVIDRLSSVPAVMRGTEYKTNTTNRAIQSYESQLQTRLDEKMDAIEEAIGGVMKLVAELCLQYMQIDEVTSIIGPEAAQGWRNLDVNTIHRALGITIVGGSTVKPTSTAKKEQAMNMMQMMGQFASATPFSFVVALKMLGRAFNDDLNLEQQDWTMLMESIMQQLQRGNSQAGGAEEEQGAAPEGGGEPPAPEQQQMGGPEQILEQIVQAIDGMPPEIRAQFGEMLANGVPIKEALAQLSGAAPSDGE
jgi:hypothetical protein